MYSREIGGRTFTFEPSGGLLNASLVMQDKETDSYWSIMTETALYGAAKGATLETLPGSAKMTWGDWKARHPATRVLSVKGVEHDANENYARYFSSEQGFRGLGTGDNRLPDKQSIYAFFDGDTATSVVHDQVFDGVVLELRDGRQLFAYRLADDSFYRSTSAFVAPRGTMFRQIKGRWEATDGHRVSRWNSESRRFEGSFPLESFAGFDTFWYIWSLTHEGSVIATGGPRSFDQ